MRHILLFFFNNIKNASFEYAYKHPWSEGIKPMVALKKKAYSASAFNYYTNQQFKMHVQNKRYVKCKLNFYIAKRLQNLFLSFCKEIVYWLEISV